MKFASTLSEAWRNVNTGTTRAALFLMISAAIMVAVSLVDLISVATILRQQQDFRAAGASIQVVQATEHISAEQCLALRSVAGVTAVVLVRQPPDPLPVAALPNTPPILFEAAGDVDHIFLGRAVDDRTGVLLSDQLAAALGVAAGDALPLREGNAQVRGTFAWPNDGRSSEFAGSAIAQVPATGLFDQCWVDVWPVNPEIRALAMSSVAIGDSDGSTPTLQQLNVRLGPGVDTADLIAHRSTTIIPQSLLAASFLLGFVAIRIRRVEIAILLRGGLRRGPALVQLLLETLSWCVTSGIISCAVILLVARFVTLPGDDAGLAGMQFPTIASAVSATLFGAAAGFFTVRRRALFRYAKDR